MGSTQSTILYANKQLQKSIKHSIPAFIITSLLGSHALLEFNKPEAGCSVPVSFPVFYVVTILIMIITIEVL